MTGWGQEGPYAPPPATTSTTSPCRAPSTRSAAGEGAVPPLNMIGDFGGGAMLLALGICAAARDRRPVRVR